MAQIHSDKRDSQDVSRFQATIEQNFPDLQISSVKELGEGWMSQAVLVNETYVFRFPKHIEGADDLKKEITLLPELASQITLRIPQFQFVGTQPNGLPFVGYEIIRGELLDERLFEKMSDSIKDRIAQQIATFMDQIQSFPVDRALALGATKADMQADYAEDLQSVRRSYASLPKDVTEYLEKRFAEYLNTKKYGQYEPKLIHADLSIDHLLLDREKGELSGIIDFGDAQVADPDYEYTYLLKTMGVAFTKLVMKKRREKNIDEKMKKAGYFVTFDLVDDILGVELLGIPPSTKERAIQVLQTELKNQ